MRLQFRLWWHAIKRHQGLHLCWIYPGLGLLSGAIGHAEDHRIERGLAAAAALALLVWPSVLRSAWTARNQYKDTP